MIFIGLLCAVLVFFAVGRTGVRTTYEPMAETPLAWQDRLPTGAAAAEQPVLLYFTASWCPPCRIMKSEVLPSQRVVDAAEGYVPVMIDVEDDPVTAGQFQVTSIPTTVILGPDGNLRARLSGLLSPGELEEVLNEHR